MAEMISLREYERYAKKQSISNRLRGFKGIYEHPGDFRVVRNAGASNKLLFEVTVDLSIADRLIELFQGFGYKTFGDDYYYMEAALEELNSNEAMRKRIKDEDLEKLTNEVLDKKTRETKYQVLENDDVKFYVLPYSEDTESVYDFIKLHRDELYSFAKHDDVTIVMKPIGLSQAINGFISFNFLDLDEKEEGKEVEVDCAYGFNVAVNFKDKTTIYASALYLSALAGNDFELEELNTHIYAENYR